MRLKFIMVSIMVLSILALVLAGCGPKGTEPQGKPGVEQEKENSSNGSSNQQPGISAKPEQTKQPVTLYFSDDQAMYLVPEEREVVKGGDETLEEVIINELIKGPGKEGLTRTMPEGTKLLSVTVVNGVAYVNLSKEFKTKHWGGSAGETMTLYSIVNSLCKLAGIEKVQLLLEGDKQESILNGNMDTSIPIEPDYSLTKE